MQACKYCALRKGFKDATATNCFARSIEASMDLVATLVKQLQIGQEEDRKRQEEDRKQLQTVVEGVEGLKAGMLGGVFHSDILIQTEIPAEIRERKSINGSLVLGLIDDSWKVNLDQFASVDQEVKNFADFTKHSALYAALNVENDNQLFSSLKSPVAKKLQTIRSVNSSPLLELRRLKQENTRACMESRYGIFHPSRLHDVCEMLLRCIP
eukprot:g20995.t1